MDPTRLARKASQFTLLLWDTAMMDCWIIDADCKVYSPLKKCPGINYKMLKRL